MMGINTASNLNVNRDPYKSVVIALAITTLLGTACAVFAGVWLSNPVLFAIAITLFLSTGILIGVAFAQHVRENLTTNSSNQDIEAKIAPEPAEEKTEKTETETTQKKNVFRFNALGMIRISTGIIGTLAIFFLLWLDFPVPPMKPSLVATGIIFALCVLCAGMAFMAARYLGDVDVDFPEASGLTRGARVVAWILIVAGVSILFEWANLQLIVRILHFAILAINAAVCITLLVPKERNEKTPFVFSTDFLVTNILGSRPNILASILDAAQRQLGIDLRSTWALTVIRSSAEPLLIALCLIGWFSTSFTVVGLEEQGLVERFGVPMKSQPLMPGLHIHWPWPIDRISRIPVKRIQGLAVGHEGEENAGPEDVVWAAEHAANEYTLLLGNGRDLITIDATVQFRIRDARAWRYNCQNPLDALRAIAYRVVMRSTVNRTLSDALSENVITLTKRMRAMVQQEADALALGVEVVAFTVGGMHPPVPVAPDYEAVVSAEVGKTTAKIRAQAFRNETVPAAEALVLVDTNTARAEGEETLARAAGEAWSFRTLQSQYRAGPSEFLFRRRLETLENTLGGRHFTVADFRIQRDGGELWLMP